MQSRPSAEEQREIRLWHKHGLDEWSPMMPERSAQPVVPGEEPADEFYRCQRIGCTEVVRRDSEPRPA